MMRESVLVGVAGGCVGLVLGFLIAVHDPTQDPPGACVMRAPLTTVDKSPETKASCQPCP